MKITRKTTKKEVLERTKNILYLDAIPKMNLKYNNANNYKNSEENYRFWLEKII